jgi:hypothetical protein
MVLKACTCRNPCCGTYGPQFPLKVPTSPIFPPRDTEPQGGYETSTPSPTATFNTTSYMNPASECKQGIENHPFFSKGDPTHSRSSTRADPNLRISHSTTARFLRAIPIDDNTIPKGDSTTYRGLIRAGRQQLVPRSSLSHRQADWCRKLTCTTVTNQPYIAVARLLPSPKRSPLYCLPRAGCACQHHCHHPQKIKFYRKSIIFPGPIS